MFFQIQNPVLFVVVRMVEISFKQAEVFICAECNLLLQEI